MTFHKKWDGGFGVTDLLVAPEALSVLDATKLPEHRRIPCEVEVRRPAKLVGKTIGIFPYTWLWWIPPLERIDFSKTHFLLCYPDGEVCDATYESAADYLQVRRRARQGGPALVAKQVTWLAPATDADCDLRPSFSTQGADEGVLISDSVANSLRIAGIEGCVLNETSPEET